MKKIKASSVWIWAIIALPVIFIIWTVWLIISVNHDRKLEEENVFLISKLTLLEQSLRDLERPLAYQNSHAESLPNNEYWQTLYNEYRERLKAFDFNTPAAKPLEPFIFSVDSLVQRMESIYMKAGPRSANAVKLKEADTLFYHEKNRAVDKVKEAIRLVRVKQADISFRLTGKWQQLNFLVLLSCLLTMILAVLLKVFQQNVLKQQETETALFENEKKYRTLLENISELITVANPNGEIVYLSRNFVEFTGYAAKEKLGSLIFDNLHPEDRERAHKAFAEMAAAKKPVGANYRVIHRNGSVVWFEARGNQFTDVDKKVRVIIISRDISKRKQLEAQLLQARKIEALGTLAGGIAHDFNNILAAIMGYTELVRDELPDDSSARERLAHIQKASLRGKDLVNQILTFGREKKAELKPLNIEKVVQETIKLLQASAPPSIKIMEHIHPNCGLILADATRIHQVVMNLGTNAFHAMQAAGGILDIILMPIKVDEELLRTNPRLKEGAYVQLTVRDTGHGMDAATMERIFDPFFTTKPVNQGTGMGLSVVHAIIENHGGVITVESEPGQGAAFTIYFPKIEEKRENNIPLLQIYSEGHEHILFVDDEDMLLQTGKQMLERLGYQVTTTNSSREALEKFRQSPDHFNLVITDQVMPQMTGLELAKELFRIRPTIPVLLMTGYSEMVSPETVQESGICQMSLKPTSSRQLGETIRKILNAEKNVQA